MEDTIIEELHKFREEWAAQFNYDIHAIVADLRRSQQEENRQVINLPPKLVTNNLGKQADVDDQATLESLSATHRVS